MLDIDEYEDDGRSHEMESALLASIRDPRHVGAEIGVEIGIDEDPKVGGEHQREQEGDDVPLIREVSARCVFGIFFAFRCWSGGRRNFLVLCLVFLFHSCFGVHSSRDSFSSFSLYRHSMSELDFESLDEKGVEDDLKDTFMQMEYRKVKRLTSGKFRDVRSTREIQNGHGNRMPSSTLTLISDTRTRGALRGCFATHSL